MRGWFLSWAHNLARNSCKQMADLISAIIEVYIGYKGDN